MDCAVGPWHANRLVTPSCPCANPQLSTKYRMLQCCAIQPVLHDHARESSVLNCVDNCRYLASIVCLTTPQRNLKASSGYFLNWQLFLCPSVWPATHETADGVAYLQRPNLLLVRATATHQHLWGIPPRASPGRATFSLSTPPPVLRERTLSWPVSTRRAAYRIRRNSSSASSEGSTWRKELDSCDGFLLRNLMMQRPTFQIKAVHWSSGLRPVRRCYDIHLADLSFDLPK